MESKTEQVAVKRPGGVTFIAALNLLGAAIVTILAIGGEGRGAEPVLLLGAAVGAAVSVGLLAQRRWARWAAIFLYGINLLAALAGPNPIGVLIAAWITAYLAFNEDVRRAFAKPVTAEAAEIRPTVPGPTT